MDPRTGRQTLVASGFKTTKAILIEPSATLLVADEVGGSPIWGYLWRLNLKTGEKSEVYRFAPSEVATGMGVDLASSAAILAAATSVNGTQATTKRLLRRLRDLGVHVEVKAA